MTVPLQPSSFVDKYEDYRQYHNGILMNYQSENMNSSLSNEYWYEHVTNQLQNLHWKIYSGRNLWKSPKRFKVLDMNNTEFMLDMCSLSQFGLNLFKRIINLTHFNELPPKSGGFVVIQDVLDANYFNIDSFVNYITCVKEGWKDILDHNERNADDIISPDYVEPIGKRKQIHLEAVLNTAKFPAFMNDIYTILKWMFPLHDLNDLCFLVSEEGVQHQRTHTDYQQSFQNIIQGNDIMPYGVLIALDSEVKLTIFKDIYGNGREEAIVPQYGMIVFCGNIYHAGYKYTESSRKLAFLC